MKKKILAISLAAICIATFAYGTVAYFTAEETAHNVITTGNIDIELYEWADEEKTVPFPEEGVEGIMPGMEVTKIVEVKNIGANAAFVRVKVTKAIELAETVEGFEPNLDLIGIKTGKDWTLKIIDGENWYYYEKELIPGETTTPLFEGVKFDGPGMGNEYKNSQISVSVLAQGVQSANNNPLLTGGDVTEVVGWPGGGE